jgi:hypothetical protein
MASKGKGKAGDAATAPVAPAEGAKFMTVRCGTDVDSISVLINLNCNVDVLLDGMRSAVLSKLDAIISVRKGAIDAANADREVGEAGDTASPAPSQGEESAEAKSLAKLIEIRGKITQDGSVVDLTDDAGTLLNVREQAKKVACEGVLTNRAKYTLAAISKPAEGSGSAAPAPYICFASVTAPVAAVADPKAKKK